MNSIQRLILFNQNEDALEYLSRFSRLSRRLLSSSKSGLHSLKDEVDFVHNYLSLESLRYKDKFSWEIIADFTDEQFGFMVPNMMVQPFIENAIQHAFRENLQTNKILVAFKMESEKLIIHVIDNGVGREFTLKNTKNNHESYGIQIVRDRLKLMRTKSNQFTLFIHDLSNNEGPTGTKVTIELPLYK